MYRTLIDRPTMIAVHIAKKNDSHILYCSVTSEMTSIYIYFYIYIYVLYIFYIYIYVLETSVASSKFIPRLGNAVLHGLGLPA